LVPNGTSLLLRMKNNIRIKEIGPHRFIVETKLNQAILSKIWLIKIDAIFVGDWWLHIPEKKGSDAERRKDEGNEVQERRGEGKSSEMGMGGERAGRSKGIQVIRVYTTEERGIGGTHKGKHEERSGRDGTGMGDRKKKIRRRLAEED
jgi:hypothetical protein